MSGGATVSSLYPDEVCALAHEAVDRRVGMSNGSIAVGIDRVTGFLGVGDRASNKISAVHLVVADSESDIGWPVVVPARRNSFTLF